jgi:A/G-specific adenine glycosylase
VQDAAAVPGLPDLIDALFEWYRANRRDLPWRRTTDPYAILVSEVMLQQTQVARVVPRFEAWLERWPTAAALAAAPVADVLREWVGLGYNRRALRLREACAVVAECGWPADLAELPGVGPYTAAAVAAFAFGRDTIALDTNVRRLFRRLGRQLAPRTGEGAVFNQATIELGALVCRARAPRCEACPLEPHCAWEGDEPRERRPAARFEDTDRWVRGRVVAALAAGEALPQVEPRRLERALAALVQDGLIQRDGDALRLG